MRLWLIRAGPTLPYRLNRSAGNHTKGGCQTGGVGQDGTIPEQECSIGVARVTGPRDQGGSTVATRTQPPRDGWGIVQDGPPGRGVGC